MSTETSYSWLRQLPKEVLTLNQAPLFGYPPEYDLSLMAKELSQALGAQIDISDSTIDTRDLSHLKEGFHENTLLLPFKIAPLRGVAFILVPQEALHSLIKKELPVDFHKAIDKELVSAYQDFTIAHAIQAFQKSFPDKTLIPQFAQESTLPEESMLSKEISLKIEGVRFPARLLITQELLKSWKEKFQKRAQPAGVLNELYVNIHLEAGRVSLTREEFKSLEVGDYLVLDSCQLTPGENKGRVLLTLEKRPIFRAKIKDGQLKILEYPFLYEDRTPMAKDSQHDEELEDDQTDEYIEEEEEEEIEEGEVDSPENASTPNAQSQKIAPPSAQAPIKTEEIPLDIVVEVGKFKITVQKLSELKPGQVLDLGFNPDDGVDLVLNGHLVAKGELLKVGDTLGVRILDIAH